MSSRTSAWRRTNTFRHSQFQPQRLAAERDGRVSVCLPARDEERTIGTILEQLVGLGELGLVDQIVVVDHSTDRTAAVARGFGVEVYDQMALMPEFGPALGKGDAMWRGLTVLRGDYVCYLDADSEGFGRHFVSGLLGPLLTRPEIPFVKGFYRRPFRVGDLIFP